MGKQNAPVTSFNHGMVSRLALARVDLARMRFAAEEQTNWLPRTVGPMTLRPGSQYIGSTKNDAKMEPIPFVFASDDTAIIEMTAGAMRVRVNDELVTRPSVGTTIQSGTFDASTGWTLTTTSGAAAIISGGALTLNAAGIGSLATASQVVIVQAADIGVEHGVRINISAYAQPVQFKIGSAADGDDLIETTSLGGGEHSLAFTPTTGLIYIQFESRLRPNVSVESIQIDSAGTLELSTPYSAADLDMLRYTQSADVVYIACVDHAQWKIERRGTTSWSFVRYLPKDGPFKIAATADVLISPDGIHSYGTATLTSDVPFFMSSMVGGLLRLTHGSQRITSSLSDDDTYSEPVRLTGVHDPDNFLTSGRMLLMQILGDMVGTVTLQRSFDGPDFGYEDITTFTSAVGPVAIQDEFDNSIAWYRFAVKPGDYTSGTFSGIMAFPGGGGSGVVRIMEAADNSTTAVVNILETLKNNLEGTRDWQLGEWSDLYRFPTAVALHEGRLWWSGQDRIYGSVSDAYESYDVTLDGDAASIQRSIGYGPVENISWMLSLQRLIMGTGNSEISIRASSFDEPLTPTNFGLKDASTQGSALVSAAKIDSRGLFVTRSGRRLYQLLFSVQDGDYASNDLTALLPDLDTNLIRIAVQRHPDTRIHVVRADGTAMVLLFEPSEEVICWYKVETDGLIESVCVLPENVEDRVYYVIKRNIDGQDVRYIEKFARLDQCTGLPEARLSDSHVVYSAAATTTITGLDHLEGETVVAWAWDDDDDTGTDFGTLGEATPTYTVTGGSITLPEAKENAVVGLPYTARFKSAKLAYAAQAGTALTQKKRIDHLGLILMNTHAQGIRFGQTFERMNGLPQKFKEDLVSADHIYEDFDQPSIGVPGTWDTDSRLCIEARAPRPCTALGAVISISTHDKA